MPIYEYVCKACDRITELMQKVGEGPPAKCPSCGSKRMAKAVSRTSFQLKGGGWYSDLYASPKEKGKGKEKAGETGGAAEGVAATPAQPKKEKEKKEKKEKKKAD